MLTWESWLRREGGGTGTFILPSYNPELYCYTLNSVVVSSSKILTKQINRLIERSATLRMHTQSQNKECAHLLYLPPHIHVDVCLCVNCFGLPNLGYQLTIVVTGTWH